MEREKQLAEQKRALEEEVSTLAAASNTISVFIADLRSRQGRLQLKLSSLPDEIDQCRRDTVCLMDILSSCRQGIVTNIHYALEGKAQLTDIQTVARKPDEFVKAMKTDPKVKRIMEAYNNGKYGFELDKAVENLAFENRRLLTSYDLLKKGKSIYGDKLSKANANTGKTTSEIKRDLDKVEERIKVLQSQIGVVRSQSLISREARLKQIRVASDEMGPLKIEQKSLRQLLDMSSNTKLQADASSSGIDSNFGLQEKQLRDEYEANVRQSFIDVERAVLNSVSEKKAALEQELESSENDLASIQLILNAHTKGQMSQRDMLGLYFKYTNTVSGQLSSAADRLFQVGILVPRNESGGGTTPVAIKQDTVTSHQK